MLTESAKCDVILGTHTIASEGLNIPDLNTEIIATPVSEVEQSVGRILRKFHEKINPIVVDLIDQCGNFGRQGSSRAKFYKDEDYIIQDYKISLDKEPQETDGIKDYLLDTTAKQSKEHIEDDEAVEESIKLGRCVFDDNDPSETQQTQPQPQPQPQTQTQTQTQPVKKGLCKCLLDDTPPQVPAVLTKKKLVLKKQ
jgi:superfamily II DNA or RNA helicase